MRPIYKSYVFTEREKDPIIHECADAFKASHANGTSFKDVERSGGPKSATLRNWFYGTTTRPQVTTVRAFLRSIGKDIVIVDGVRKIGAYRKQDLLKKLPDKRRKKK